MNDPLRRSILTDSSLDIPHVSEGRNEISKDYRKTNRFALLALHLVRLSRIYLHKEFFRGTELVSFFSFAYNYKNYNWKNKACLNCESHRLRLRTKTLLKFSLKYAIIG